MLGVYIVTVMFPSILEQVTYTYIYITIFSSWLHLPLGMIYLDGYCISTMQ